MNANIRIPGSKSITHRALVIAALAQGRSLLKGPLFCEDTVYTLHALQELGIRISADRKNTSVSGTGGNFHPARGIKEIFLGNSGTSYRLLLSMLGLAQGDFILSGSPRMRKRPVGELVRALNNLGVEAICTGRDGFPPVFIKAKCFHGGKVEMAGNRSSQYVSSILLTSPYTEKGVEIEVTGNLVSRPYVDITIEVMKAFGISADRDGYRYFRVSAPQIYQSCQFNIEGDVSTASYFWAAAAVTGGTVVTKNIYPNTTKQGDIAFLDIMEEMGCHIHRERDRIVVQGRMLCGLEVDMRDMPDMVPTLAAIALFAKGKTVIRNVPHLRHKESDRLQAITFEWRRIGGKVEERPDGLIIHGERPLKGTVVDTHEDHRMAMSLAVVGLGIPGIRIKNEE